MALQLPAVQKLGEEIGINVAGGIERVAGEFSKNGGRRPMDTPPTAEK